MFTRPHRFWILLICHQRDDCSNILESSANSLVDVAHHFLKNESKKNTPSNDHRFQNIIDDTNKNDSLVGFLIDDDYENSNNKISKYNINMQLQREKIDFLKILKTRRSSTHQPHFGFPTGSHCRIFQNWLQNWWTYHHRRHLLNGIIVCVELYIAKCNLDWNRKL
jgi:hypothetical protein